MRQLGLRAHNDVVDGDVDELDEEPDEALKDRILKNRKQRLKYPSITIMPKPMAVAIAILENSFLSGFVHLERSI